MSKLIFRENKDKYEKTVIEVGYYEKRNNGDRFFYSVLDIWPDEEFVETDCGDTYYDYNIDFDTILAVADKIKELRKEKENKNGK